MGDEFVFTAGQKIQQSSSLRTWPITPEWQSGPSSLIFSSYLALPAGLSLDPQTGKVSGTPTRAAAKKAYTIRADASEGAATTTLFITVLTDVGETPVEDPESFTGPLDGVPESPTVAPVENVSS